MSAQVRVGDIGTVIRLTVKNESGTVVDVSGATTKEILLRKPSDTLLTKAAAFTTDGTDGKIQYTTVAGDLDEAGTWLSEAYVELLAWEGHSDIDSFEVGRVLS